MKVITSTPFLRIFICHTRRVKTPNFHIWKDKKAHASYNKRVLKKGTAVCRPNMISYNSTSWPARNMKLLKLKSSLQSFHFPHLPHYFDFRIILHYMFNLHLSIKSRKKLDTDFLFFMFFGLCPAWFQPRPRRVLIEQGRKGLPIAANSLQHF